MRLLFRLAAVVLGVGLSELFIAMTGDLAFAAFALVPVIFGIWTIANARIVAHFAELEMSQ